MAQLLLEDAVKRCDCGLLVEDATLPRGWSMHLSQHPSSLGEERLSFVHHLLYISLINIK